MHPFIAGTSKLWSFGLHSKVAPGLAQGAQRPARRSVGRFCATSKTQRQSSGRGGAPEGAAPSVVLHGRGNLISHAHKNYHFAELLVIEIGTLAARIWTGFPLPALGGKRAAWPVAVT